MKKTMRLKAYVRPLFRPGGKSHERHRWRSPAKVDLEAKTAHIQLSKEVSDETLKNAVTEAGYEVVGLE